MRQLEDYTSHLMPPRIYKFGEKGSGIHAPSLSAIQDYEKIKNDCLRKGVLFEDPAFPANESSIYYSKNRQTGRFKWLRASEIATDATFILEGASRFDVKQGELGDCWLLAAIANLTLNPKLFHMVVPPDQTFRKPGYAGIIHFHFHHYGKWVDLVIDDKLPTVDGRLVFMHSKDKNEFWSALLEKAYAKLHGSYEALKGGTTCEAMEDFTGGLTEFYELQDKDCPADLFQIMMKARERSSFMGCSINAGGNQIEAELPNGLVVGHAYSITAVRMVDVQTPRVKGKIPLIRIRNPWGNETEWKGAWSDKSKEWTCIPDSVKKGLNLSFDGDGEFWMSFQDFKTNFNRLEICNLGPDGLDEEVGVKQWQTTHFDGSWVAGVSAGGCRNNLETFAMNPQFMMELVDHDEDDDDDKCTLIVALMQKNHRAKRKMGLDSLTIGFTVYNIKDEKRENPVATKGYSKVLSTEYFKYNASVASSPQYINLRVVSGRFRLPPGKYIIIPSTFDADEEGEFLLRIFSEKAPGASGENDDDIGMMEEKPQEEKEIQADEEFANKVSKRFALIAGDDMEVDADELQTVLNAAFKKDFNFDGFSIDSCRSMIALLDKDKSGTLGLDEFITLWKCVREWCTVFKTHDADNSGTINAKELREALNTVRFSVNRNVLQALVLRYGNLSSGKRGDIRKERALSFDAFVHCCIKLKWCIETWNSQTSLSPDNRPAAAAAPFTLNEWVEYVMYC